MAIMRRTRRLIQCPRFAKTGSDPTFPAMVRASPNDISLIPEKPDKLTLVLDRIREAFVDHLVADRGTERRVAEQMTAEILNREISTASSEGKSGFFLILRGKDNVGLIWKTERIVADRKTWHLLYIETFVPHRNTGIAHTAMRHLIRFAKQNGVSEITLNVSPRNTSAVNLYKKLGFTSQPGGLSFKLHCQG